jgi:hypothetical protein
MVRIEDDILDFSKGKPKCCQCGGKTATIRVIIGKSENHGICGYLDSFLCDRCALEIAVKIIHDVKLPR